MNRIMQLLGESQDADGTLASLVDWGGVAEVLSEVGVPESSIIAASWAAFGTANIEARFSENAGVALIYPKGFVVTAGKRKRLSKKLQYSQVTMPPCKNWGEADTTDSAGTFSTGKYCIEFGGPGNVFLGRLEWWWTGKRFRDPREKMMVAATERDRVLAIVSAAFG